MAEYHVHKPGPCTTALYHEPHTFEVTGIVSTGIVVAKVFCPGFSQEDL